MKINTGIKSNSKFENILSSVLGQLSDGIWENSRSMEKYWKNLSYSTNAQGYIELEDRAGVCPNVTEFFANKIKQIIKIEIDDGNSELEWNRSCGAVPSYMHGNVTVGDCYQLYELLKGRQTATKSYTTYNTYNVILTYEDVNIHMQVEALSAAAAKRKAIELFASKAKATAEIA